MYFNTAYANNNWIIPHHFTGGSNYKHKDDDIEVIFINGMVTSEPFYIKMTDNDDFEDDKMFRVTIDPLSLPYGTTLGSGGSANVIIKDDEGKLHILNNVATYLHNYSYYVDTHIMLW